MLAPFLEPGYRHAWDGRSGDTNQALSGSNSVVGTHGGGEAGRFAFASGVGATVSATGEVRGVEETAPDCLVSGAPGETTKGVAAGVASMSVTGVACGSGTGPMSGAGVAGTGVAGIGVGASAGGENWDGVGVGVTL